MGVEAPQAQTLVGSRVMRVEDPRLLLGRARYVGDLDRPRLCEAAFVRSAVAHGTIKSIDVSEALAAPGVLAVLTSEDIASLTPLTDLIEVDGAIKTPRPALPSDRVRYVGEPIAMVVAKTRYLAEDAAERIVVDIDELEALRGVEQSVKGVQLFDDVPENICFRTDFESEGLDAAMAGAAHRVKRTIEINRQISAALEARAVLAEFDPPSGELTVWISSQAPFQQRYLFSLALGLPESLIRVIAPDVGGAFGPKDFVFPEDLCVCRASQLLGRPVRWSEDRLENLTAGSQAKQQTIELEIGFQEDGTIVAMRSRAIGDTGAFSYSAPGGLVDTMMAATSLPGPYAVPQYGYEVLGVLTNKPPVAPYRGVGYTAAQTVREIVLDEAARELGIDRVELRRRNLLGPEPTVTVTGQEYDGGSYEEAVDLALENIDYAGFEQRREEARARGRELGIGISPFVEVTSLGTRAGRHTVGFDVFSHDHARAAIDLTGFVTVGVPTSSHGQGHATAYAQIAADTLGVGLHQVRVYDRDTDKAPWGMGTFSSRSAVFGGGAVMKATAVLRDKILQVAALLLEAPPEALELADGFAGIKGVPEAKIPLAELAAAAHFDPGVREAIGESGLRAGVFHDSAPAVSNGCIVVEAEVDPELAAAKLTRVVAVEDCGVMLNPLLVDGQVKGGFAQGFGAAVLEDAVFSDGGQPQSTTFMDYLLPRSTDLVEVEVSHISTPSSVTFGGMKGMAEGASIGGPAAVINAVADALRDHDFKVGKLPLGPQSIYESLAAGSEPE